MNQQHITNMTKISLCVALICISAYISIPIPFTAVLITAQTLVVNLIALILKPKQSFTAILVYLLIGICGVPVFSGGTAGIGRLVSPSGGFLIGFLIAVPLISLVKGNSNKIYRYVIATILVGMPVIYIFGTLFMCITQKIALQTALMSAVIPFIAGDIGKCIVASLIAVPLNKYLPQFDDKKKTAQCSVDNSTDNMVK